jgi:hypothetical protein
MFKKIKIELQNYVATQEDKKIIFDELAGGITKGIISDGFSDIEWSYKKNKLKYFEIINQKRITAEQIQAKIEDVIFPKTKKGKDMDGKWVEYEVSSMEDSHLINSINLIEKKIDIDERLNRFLNELQYTCQDNESLTTYFSLIKEAKKRNLNIGNYVFDNNKGENNE